MIFKGVLGATQYLDCAALGGGGYVSVRRTQNGVMLAAGYEVVYDVPGGEDKTDPVIRGGFKSLAAAEAFACEHFMTVRNEYQPWRKV
jgi:hypothetical protein